MLATEALTLEEHYRPVFSGLENVVWFDNGAYWKACCPAHQDKVPSLSLRICSNGNLVVKCHAGCSFDRIVQALKLEAKDFFPPSERYSTRMNIVCHYDYTYEDGKLAYQTVRLNPKDFRQRRPDPDKPKEWLWNLNGMRLVPYALPALLSAYPERAISVCEGEKDADALRRIGLIATTNVCGAGKWREEYNRYFYRRKVVLFGDNDEGGRQHVRQVETHLSQVVSSLRIVELPGLPEKGDLSFWLGQFPVSTPQNQKLKELHQLVKAAPERLAVKVPAYLSQLVQLTVGDGLAAVRKEYVEVERLAFGLMDLPDAATSHSFVDQLERLSLTSRFFSTHIKVEEPK